MPRKLVDDANFLIYYKDIVKPKGNETIQIEVKSNNQIIQIDKEGVVSANE